jgi:hypothetical protein
VVAGGLPYISLDSARLYENKLARVES